jgi:hypothetical protein
MQLFEQFGELVQTGPVVICLNPGCGNLSKQVTKTRYSPFCKGCNTRYSKGRLFPKRITPIKTFRCANEHGILGYPCVINWKLVDEIGYRITTHIDHIDGNHLNNTLDNTMELCPECHHRKSSENGDYCKH